MKFGLKTAGIFLAVRFGCFVCNFQLKNFFFKGKKKTRPLLIRLHLKWILQCLNQRRKNVGKPALVFLSTPLGYLLWRALVSFTLNKFKRTPRLSHLRQSCDYTILLERQLHKSITF